MNHPTLTWILFGATAFLAYSNGTNDNFKGVATLYGSATTTYRRVLIWATLATLAGGLLSITLAHGLIRVFSGAGLVGGLSFSPTMLMLIGLAAGATIILATVLGMPTSTTHALTGALVGVGIIASPSTIDWHTLLNKFAEPLLLSPVLAIAGTTILYPVMHRLRQKLGINARTCICVGNQAPQPATVLNGGIALIHDRNNGGRVTVQMDDATRCIERYDGAFLGIRAQSAIDALHWLSGGAVCFARALNDTPKIAALLLAANALGLGSHGEEIVALLSTAMVAGGLLQTRKVAETMSRHITELNAGQGLAANLVTAGLVLGASHLGVPVSTTHVSCGAIFGIGAINGKRRWSTISAILTTWFTTLPMALIISALLYRAFLS